MTIAAIKQDFQGLAREYDDFIRRLIPYYEDQNQAILEVIPYGKDDAFHALDLGAGTGALSKLILSNFPKAEVTMLDMTEDMLAQSTGILADYASRTHTILGDFESADFAGPYDLAVAGLSIHHVDDTQKRQLFQKVSGVLKPGSWFLIRDYVKGATPEVNALYEKVWQKNHNFKDAAEEQKYHDHMRHDQPSLLANQLSWLEEAGFEQVDCYLKYFAFCVFGGRKRG